VKRDNAIKSECEKVKKRVRNQESKSEKVNERE
jgi:hypothetical protein